MLQLSIFYRTKLFYKINQMIIAKRLKYRRKKEKRVKVQNPKEISKLNEMFIKIKYEMHDIKVT